MRWGIYCPATQQATLVIAVDATLCIVVSKEKRLDGELLVALLHSLFLLNELLRSRTDVGLGGAAGEDEDDEEVFHSVLKKCWKF